MFDYAEPLQLIDITERLNWTTEGGLVKGSLICWGALNVVTAGATMIGEIPARIIDETESGHPATDTLFSFIMGSMHGGIFGSSAAVAGLVAYAGYKKFVG